MLKHYDMALTVWQPLAASMLSDNKDAQKVRLENRGGNALTDAQERIMSVIREISQECESSPAQVCLNFLRQQPGTIIPIIGARKTAHIRFG